jgi:hypothetical protein
MRRCSRGGFAENKHEPNCQQSVHLWDALAHITGELSKLPGRPVILAVTDGRDQGSSYTWNQVIAKSNAFIRPAGISVPLPDPAVLADPTTISTGPELTPDMGTRVPLKNPQ